MNATKNNKLSELTPVPGLLNKKGERRCQLLLNKDRTWMESFFHIFCLTNRAQLLFFKKKP
jgi:hypothetical protein